MRHICSGAGDPKEHNIRVLIESGCISVWGKDSGGRFSPAGSGLGLWMSGFSSEACPELPVFICPKSFLDPGATLIISNSNPSHELQALFPA